MSLRSYMNAQLKAMGKTVKQAQKDAGKYKSIAAAKKAGSLYYTDKNGKVMAAVYAEDLKKSSPKPKPKPAPAPKSKPKTKVPGDPRLNISKPKTTPNSRAIARKTRRIAELSAEKRRLQKIVEQGRKNKPPLPKRRESARIREIEGIIKGIRKDIKKISNN